LIERAYAIGEALGIEVWCQDEAGPYQAIPQQGSSWRPLQEGQLQPHEYIRGGTAKMLTLFRPATGELRAQGVKSAPNVVLHPWLKAQIEQILASGHAQSTQKIQVQVQVQGRGGDWEEWLGYKLNKELPPIRMLLIWDNLAGHKSWKMVEWLLEHGVVPLYTPLSGSWLNMAESVQRIVVRRALCGERPQSAEEAIRWLEETVEGWNRHPTPFEWGGKRQERRKRARLRRLGGSGAAVVNGYSFAA
jgi:DDE superfamily endonuclease